MWLNKILLATLSIVGVFQIFPQQESEVVITYLGNEGILISSSTNKVLIDALHDFYKPAYVYPDAELVDDMIQGQGEFSYIEYLLVTHVHGDHFDPELAAGFISAHPESLLMGPEQILDSLKSRAAFNEADKYVLADHRWGRRTLSDNNGVVVESLGMKHVGSAHRRIQHVGYLVTLNGIKIFHMGDADFDRSKFNSMKLPAENIDIAVLPYWLVEDHVQIVDLIAAEAIILTHISPDQQYIDPAAIKEKYPDITIFTEISQEMRY